MLASWSPADIMLALFLLILVPQIFGLPAKAQLREGNTDIRVVVDRDSLLDLRYTIRSTGSKHGRYTIHDMPRAHALTTL